MAPRSKKPAPDPSSLPVLAPELPPLFIVLWKKKTRTAFEAVLALWEMLERSAHNDVGLDETDLRRRIEEAARTNGFTPLQAARDCLYRHPLARAPALKDRVKLDYPLARILRDLGDASVLHSMLVAAGDLGRLAVEFSDDLSFPSVMEKLMGSLEARDAPPDSPPAFVPRQFIKAQIEYDGGVERVRWTLREMPDAEKQLLAAFKPGENTNLTERFLAWTVRKGHVFFAHEALKVLGRTAFTRDEAEAMLLAQPSGRVLGKEFFQFIIDFGLEERFGADFIRRQLDANAYDENFLAQAKRLRVRLSREEQRRYVRTDLERALIWSTVKGSPIASAVRRLSRVFSAQMVLDELRGFNMALRPLPTQRLVDRLLGTAPSASRQWTHYAKCFHDASLGDLPDPSWRLRKSGSGKQEVARARHALIRAYVGTSAR